MKFNKSDVKELKYITEVGTYNVKVAGWEEREYNNDPVEDFVLEDLATQKTIKLSIFLNDKSRWVFVKFRSELGFEDDPNKEYDTETDCKECIGKTLTIDVEKSPAKVNPITGATTESKYLRVGKFYAYEETPFKE